MKLFSVLFVVFFGLLGSTSPAVAMMHAPGSTGSSTQQQKPQHETKKPPVGKTPSSKQQNYQTVPLTVPVKQNR